MLGLAILAAGRDRETRFHGRVGVNGLAVLVAGDDGGGNGSSAGSHRGADWAGDEGPGDASGRRAPNHLLIMVAGGKRNGRRKRKNPGKGREPGYHGKVPSPLSVPGSP